MAARRRRRADLPDRLHGVGEDDGGAAAGGAPGLGVRRPGQGDRGRRRARRSPTSSRRRGRRGSGSARPRRCARWPSAGRRWSRPGAARLAARRTSSAMLAEGRVFWLGVSAEEAVRRAGKASGRPLLDGAADPVAAARKLLECAAAVLRAGPRAGGHRRPRTPERDCRRHSAGLR